MKTCKREFWPDNTLRREEWFVNGIKTKEKLYPSKKFLDVRGELRTETENRWLPIPDAHGQQNEMTIAPLPAAHGWWLSDERINRICRSCTARERLAQMNSDTQNQYAASQNLTPYPPPAPFLPHRQ